MSTTATPPASVPASSVIPFPTPWMANPTPWMATPPVPMPGCCPPGGGMSDLNQCYWQIQQAQAFLSAMIVDLMNNDPAVQAATVAALLKSGVPVPTIGVTNGVAAPAGQVGEVVQLAAASLPYAAVYGTQNVSLGILQPGDYAIWMWADTFTTAAPVITGVIIPQPAGFSPVALAGAAPAQGSSVVSNPGQANISVATNVMAQLGVQGAANGTCTLHLFALRIR